MTKLSIDTSNEWVNLLIASTEDMEVKLTDGGYDKAQVSQWLFHVRDTLYEWRSTQALLVKALSAEDIHTVPELIEDFAAAALYGFGGELKQNMNDLLQLLDEFFPEEDEEDDLADEN